MPSSQSSLSSSSPPPSLQHHDEHNVNTIMMMSPSPVGEGGFIIERSVSNWLWRQTLAASSAATLTGLFITPFDVVKNRMQVQTSLAAAGGGAAGGGTVLSATGMTKHIVETAGLRGLYRGIVPTLLMQIPSAGL